MHYDRNSTSWLLTDMKDPASKAVSRALHSSLMFGEQLFDFTDVQVQVMKLFV